MIEMDLHNGKRPIMITNLRNNPKKITLIGPEVGIEVLAREE